MNFSIHNYWLVFLLCIFPLFIKGQSADLIIQQSTRNVDITNKYSILADDGLTADDALKLLKNNTSKNPSELNSKKDYWFYTSIKYEDTEQKSIVLSLGVADIATLYQKKDSDSEWIESKTGWLIPKSEKSHPIGEITQIQFPLELVAGATYDILIKFKNPTNAKYKIEPKIQSVDVWEISYLKDRSLNNLVYGIVIGFLGIMFCYNSLVFIFSKDKIYLYYSIYIFSALFYIVNFTGFFLENVFPDYPKSYLFFRNIPPNIGFIAYALFAQSFLDTKNWLPRWHKVFNIFKCWMLINIVMIICFLLFTVEQTFTRQVPVLGHIFGQLFLLSFIIKLFTTKNKLAHYYAIGALSFVLTSFFLSYVVASQAIPFIIGLGVAFSGLGGELITFSLGLGYKIKIAEKDKIKAQEETQELLKNQNVTLEEKVKKRTFEIERKQEEIMTQNEELHQQQEEIIAQRDYIENKNKELSYKNQQVTDSIRYAKTIQEAILPFAERIEDAFKSHFILYKPKDIVSGDFYWQEAVGKTNFIAVLDCTGHGVPGGFMSMVGFSILNDIALKSDTQNPAEMMDLLNENLIRILQQGDKQATNSDGMDVALCAIEQLEGNKAKVTFCGAKRPLYYISPSDGKLMEIKGDRKSIGGYQPKNKPFTNVEMVLESGTILYLSTDGFADQNNDKGKKFGSPTLRRLLEEIWQQPLEEQHENLSRIFQTHCGKQPQRDDVAIIGIEL
ncbi:MAG: serine phosphatase RsbU (regulator of sigma subunit) [Flammeovirgaceae bacterium]|jgi:serine phosphatase RsbU (regulator of sigma subunit)